MNSNKGKGGVRTGIIVAAIGLVMMALPPIIRADMMGWGYAVMVSGFMVLAVGITVWLLYRHRRIVLMKMAENREVLARWRYDKEQWRAQQKREIESNKGMPVFGAVLGGIFIVIGLVFFLTDPDEMSAMLAIMAGVGVLIAFVAWLATAMRNRAVLKDPGEVIITRGGVYYQGMLTDWNGVTSWFDLAKLEKQGEHVELVLTYRYLAGRYRRIHTSSLAIPVPPGHEQDAERAMHRLNAL